MTPLCSEPTCYRVAKVKGKCSMHYQRDYAARKKAERAQEMPAGETGEETGITAEQIDAMTVDELNLCVCRDILGWLPPTDPRTIARFFELHPERKTVGKRFEEWLTHNNELYWRIGDYADWIHRSWGLMQWMFANEEPARAAIFEKLLIDARLHRMTQDDVSRFICRSALKSHLLPVDSIH